MPLFKIATDTQDGESSYTSYEIVHANTQKQAERYAHKELKEHFGKGQTRMKDGVAWSHGGMAAAEISGVSELGEQSIWSVPEKKFITMVMFPVR
jgi:hypothetical protein